MGEVERVSSRPDETTGDGAEMRARRWAIAAGQEPSTYGIPERPTLTVCECPGLALADGPDSEPFIRAAAPVQVRR